MAVFTLNINCSSDGGDANTWLQCGTTGHIVGAVFAAIVQLLYCALAFILAGSFYSRLPVSGVRLRLLCASHPPPCVDPA